MTRSILICAALLSTLVAGSAHAALPVTSDRTPVVQAEVHPSLQPWQEVRREISPREAKAIALRRVPGGKVLDITRFQDAFRVRILRPDGMRVDIFVDASTGRIR